MLKKTITYIDFDGDEQTEDFYFNLTKSEIVTLELSAPGNSFRDSMNKIIASKDGKTIMEEFQKVILMAYGIKSDDGKRFVKSEQISKDFLDSAAYDVLFLELTQEAGKAAEWITGLMPADMQGQVRDSAEVRRMSQAQMQGHKQKAAPTITREPELPTVSPAEDAVIQSEPDVVPVAQPKEDLSKLTKAELMQRLQAMQ